MWRSGCGLGGQALVHTAAAAKAYFDGTPYSLGEADVVEMKPGKPRTAVKMQTEIKARPGQCLQRIATHMSERNQNSASVSVSSPPDAPSASILGSGSCRALANKGIMAK